MLEQGDHRDIVVDVARICRTYAKGAERTCEIELEVRGAKDGGKTARIPPRRPTISSEHPYRVRDPPQNRIHLSLWICSRASTSLSFHRTFASHPIRGGIGWVCFAIIV